MAHEIETTDNLFSTRQPTWHGLGVIFPDYPTREEAQRTAHPWEPISEPVYTAEPVYRDDGGEVYPLIEHQEVDGYQAIRRSDNGAVLGIQSSTYEPVTNDEMWDIAEAVEGSGVDVQYETAGSLKGGSKVWVLLKLRDPIEIRGDRQTATVPYYTLQNAHDGSGAFRGQATMTRIVCANTSQMADLDARARGTEFTFRHTRNVRDRIDEARQALMGWRASIDDYQQFSEMMLDKPVDAYAVDEFIHRFIPAPPVGSVSDRVQENVLRTREEYRGVLYSPTNEGIEVSAYGLVAAAVEWSEHVRKAFTRESRFTRSFLTRNKIVASASKIAQEVSV